MRHLLQLTLAAGLLLAASCTGNKGGETTQATPADTVAVEPQTALTAIERYLVDSIAGGYSEAEYSIPYWVIIDSDESNPDDICVWGSYWVINYNLRGDTLKMVSGGHHPGLMHVRHMGDDFVVTAFDRVGDGSSFAPTAKKIFGDRYEAFSKVCANDSLDTAARERSLANYVLKNNLAARYYQDADWPARAIPAK